MTGADHLLFNLIGIISILQVTIRPDGSQLLALGADITATTAQMFRAEFTQLSPSLAPRINELDGLATSLVPEPSTLALAAIGALGILAYRSRR